jgi:hypothetical protein
MRAVRIALSAALCLTAVAGCKKTEDTGSASGSSAATKPAGSAEAPASGSGGAATGSAAAAGSGSAEAKSGSGAEAGSAAAGSAAAGAGEPAAGSGSAVDAMAHRAGMCPSTVFGATTKAAVKGKAVVVTIESADKDAIAAIQKRTDELLAEKKPAPAGNAHDQKGTFGGGRGLCPVPRPSTTPRG